MDANAIPTKNNTEGIPNNQLQ